MAEHEIPAEDWAEEEPKKEKPKKEQYKSQNGFIRLPVQRGFTEIKNLWQDVPPAAFCFFCGGYVRWMCSPNPNPIPAQDIDLYFESEDNYKAMVQFLEERKGMERGFENDVSLSFKRPIDPFHPYYASPIIQLIKPHNEGRMILTGSMETILENFDFTVVRAALIDPRQAVVDIDFFHDEFYRRLRIKNIHCPISSTYRVIKYAKKGYWANTPEILNLFLDWDERDDEYRLKIIDFFKKLEEGGEVTEEEVENLEKLMKID